jgi:dipeptidyl aminopeptidase/acylaminoacyl peptidase
LEVYGGSILRFLSIIAVLSALLIPVLASAAPPVPLSPDVYGRQPNVSDLTLSPSGQLYAYINVTNGLRQLKVKDLAGNLKLVAALAQDKVRSLQWADDDHVVLTMSKTSGIFSEIYEHFSTLILNVKTAKNFYVFQDCSGIFHATYGYYGAANLNGRWYGFFGGLTMQKTRGFDATFNSESFVELYRVDLDRSGCEIAARGQGADHEWALDGTGAVVAHAVYEERYGIWTLRTGAEGGDILATIQAPLAEVNLAGLGRTPGAVLIDKAIPEEWSLANGAHTELPRDGVVTGYIFDPTTRRLLGVWLGGDVSRQQFFDPVLKARQAALQKALGGNVKIQSWSADFKRLILFSEGDGDAGTYWLVDGASVKPIAYPYPDIPDADVGSVRAVVYKAQDGLEIHGLLTLPPGRDPKTLPLVVMPHGGPEGQDTVGFDWLAQAFAGHGYAVFQPNFRGSDGYGLAFRDAGFGQWGRKMQTDISDGVAELVRQGVVDPKRACIFGASYGGYAALAGVTLQQGLYRCAVSYAGIGDMSTLFDTQAQDEGVSAGSRYLQKFIGVQLMGDAILHQISPVAFVDRVEAPVLLIHGEDDTVVPISQSVEMERKLRSAGKPVEFLRIKGEDHWLSQDATRKQVLAAALAFIEAHNPPD